MEMEAEAGERQRGLSQAPGRAQRGGRTGKQNWEEERAWRTQTEKGGARAPAQESLCQGRGHISETKPDSLLGSQLLWAPQRVMASCGKWLAKKKGGGGSGGGEKG